MPARSLPVFLLFTGLGGCVLASSGAPDKGADETGAIPSDGGAAGDGGAVDDTGGDSGAADDADGDGWSAADGDCDDEDASVHPGAAEIAGDEVDEDCDGSEICYADADADGYRTDATVASADTDCQDPGEAPSGAAADCDDDASSCAADCATDADADGVVDCRDGCLDADADGYGVTNDAALDCADADGASCRLTDACLDDDCDDEDDATHPGGTEVCYDGRDNDCDGRVGTCALADAPIRFSGEAKSEGAGVAVSGAGDVDADGYDDFLVSAPDHDDPALGSHTGIVYLVRGSASPTPASLADADARLTGERIFARAGNDLAAAGDVDGDGYDDFLVGDAEAGSFTGTAYLVLGAPSVASGSLAAADAAFDGEFSGTRAGTSVSAAGDVDADGYADFLVGSPRYYDRYDPSTSLSGGAYLILGRPSIASASLAEADARFTGDAADEECGTRVASAGDVDADGFDDLLLGALGHDEASADAETGAVYLFLGSASVASASVADADARFDGESDDDQAGLSLSPAGDIDDDGYADFLVGAPGHDDATAGSDAGAVYLLLGSLSLASTSLADADAVFAGEHGGDGAGVSVSGAGDLNGDGYADFLVGASGHDEGSADVGAAYIILGAASVASASLADAAARFTGENSYDDAGFSVASAGDVDADGTPDLLVGAYGYDDPGIGTNTGAAYLILGMGL